MTLVLHITAAAGVETPFAGEWEANIPFPPGRSLSFELKIEGVVTSGVIRRLPGPAEPMPIFEGKIDGNKMTFKVKSPDGQRIIKFTGTLADDQIVFSRAVEHEDASAPSTAGFFGSRGRETFTASRTIKQPQEK